MFHWMLDVGSLLFRKFVTPFLARIHRSRRNRWNDDRQVEQRFLASLKTGDRFVKEFDIFVLFKLGQDDYKA